MVTDTILVFIERSILDAVEDSALLAKIRSISVGKKVSAKRFNTLVKLWTTLSKKRC